VRTAIRPMMRGKFGRIVNIGSVSGLSGNPGQANYAAAKAALVGFTKTVAKEMGAKGITANVIAPGFIETDMTEVLGDAVKTAVLPNIPVRRFGKPEEIAAAVAYATCDEAGFLTAQTIVVDGGMASLGRAGRATATFARPCVRRLSSVAPRAPHDRRVFAIFRPPTGTHQSAASGSGHPSHLLIEFHEGVRP